MRRGRHFVSGSSLPALAEVHRLGNTSDQAPTAPLRVHLHLLAFLSDSRARRAEASPRESVRRVLRRQQLCQPQRRYDLHSQNGLTVQVPEVPLVAGDEVVARRRNGRTEERYVLGVERHGQRELGGWNHFEADSHAVELSQPVGRFNSRFRRASSTANPLDTAVSRLLSHSMS